MERIFILLSVPVAVIVGTIVEKAEYVAPPSVEVAYSKEHPIPPLPSVGFVRVNDEPTQTSDTFGEIVAVGAEGVAITVQEYVLEGEVVHPEPLQFCLIVIELVPIEAVIGDKVVLNAPPLFEYSTLQVPVPPPLLVTPAKERDCPTQTDVTLGEGIAVGANGSETTDQEYVVEEEVLHPLPVQVERILILLSVPVAVIVGTTEEKLE